MAETKIQHDDGTATIHCDTYGGYTSVSTGPTKAEDPTKWKARYLREKDLLSSYGLDAEQLAMAEAHLGFPRPRVVTSASWGSWAVKQVREWRADDVENWAERVRSLNLK